jgi:2'-5' RNA ligase
VVIMRAFVALIPPDAALAELADAVAPLRAAHPDLRWTPIGQWHLTLAFLGEVDEGVLPELTERLARAARRHRPLPLVLAGGGRFGDRVLWTRVHAAPPTPRESCVSVRRVLRFGTASHASEHARPGDRIDGLRRLAASVAAAARRCGIPVEDRPYRPHLTLARARGGAQLDRAADGLAGFTGTPWSAEALHLVRSRLGGGPGGTAAHDVVGSWPLGGGDRAT